MPRHALAKHDLPRVIHPHRVKHVLCEIDPEDGHLLLHGTHLLWLNGFPNLLELIVAHCRRSAQGRVHFITTKRNQCRGVKISVISSLSLPIRPINFQYPEFQAVDKEKYRTPDIVGWPPAPLTR